MGISGSAMNLIVAGLERKIAALRAENKRLKIMLGIEKVPVPKVPKLPRERRRPVSDGRG